MKHILTCSFGKDSIATALLALQHGEPLDELVYSEVGSRLVLMNIVPFCLP